VDVVELRTGDEDKPDVEDAVELHTRDEAKQLNGDLLEGMAEWMLSEDVTKEEYAAFYKSLTNKLGGVFSCEALLSRRAA
jgi:hypothetical protein